IRETVQPLVVIRDHCCNLSLLEHELRDENGVRVARSAPREIASVATIPVEKRAAECANVFQRHRTSAERRTPNAQRPTSNSELSVDRCALTVGPRLQLSSDINSLTKAKCT